MSLVAPSATPREPRSPHWMATSEGDLLGRLSRTTCVEGEGRGLRGQMWDYRGWGKVMGLRWVESRGR